MATAAAAAATTTASMGYDMGHDVSSNMDAAHMDMTFFSSTTTPLFTRTWQPTSAAGYAATCLFLVFAAAVLRVLLALRPHVNAARGHGGSISRRVAADGMHQLLPRRDTGGDGGVEEAARVMEQAGKDGVLPPRPVGSTRGRMGWARRALRVPLLGRFFFAGYEVFVAAIGYLFMLAVMTMNVGYFFSVLAGIFLGAFATADADAHADTHWDAC